VRVSQETKALVCAAALLFQAAGCGRIGYGPLGTDEILPDGALEFSRSDTGTAELPDGGSEAIATLRPAMIVTGESPTAQAGSTTFGTAYQDMCPTGEVVIGYLGTTSRNPAIPWLQSIQTQCGRMSVAGPPYAVTISSGTLLPERGSNGGVAWSSLCPTDQVVVGFEGYDGSYVYQLVIHCAPLAIVADSAGYRIVVGLVTRLAPVGVPSGSQFAAIECLPGQIAMGSNIQADTWPRAFGLFCGTPSLVLL